MKGWLDENGTFYPCKEHEGHAQTITRLTGKIDANIDIASKWIKLRDRHSEEMQQLIVKGHVRKDVLKQINKGISTVSFTTRERYTDAQLKFLQEHNCYIDSSKL